MMKRSKILVNVLTFQGRRENLRWWEEVFKGWRMQKGDYDIDILVNDTKTTIPMRNDLKHLTSKYGLKLLFIDTDLWEHQAINVALKIYGGKYNYYVINTSDAWLQRDTDLENMIADINYYPDTALLIPSADKDKTGPQEIYDPTKPPTQFEITYWPRAHLIMYTDRFLKAYDYKTMDITGCGYIQICTTQLAYALKMKPVICHKVEMRHMMRMEMGDMSRYDYFHPEWAGVNTLDEDFNPRHPKDWKPECWESFYSVVRSGACFGLSYGHYLGGRCEIIDPDPKAFDADGWPKEPEKLHAYIKDVFFLKPQHFNYSGIKYTLIPEEDDENAVAKTKLKS